MKIKFGFITNSSSTSYTFYFNGDKKQFLKLVKKYKNYFEKNLLSRYTIEHVIEFFDNLFKTKSIKIKDLTRFKSFDSDESEEYKNLIDKSRFFESYVMIEVGDDFEGIESELDYAQIKFKEQDFEVECNNNH